MSEMKQMTGQRDRSPSFPFIPLKAAIERLVQFEAHHKRAPVAPDRLGPAWGMKTNTSQAQQTLAALRQYGLLETQRIATGRVVVISEEGRTYLRAQQESMKQAVIRRAALRPKQIEAYWRDWGSDRPKDAACLDALVLHGGFSSDGAEKFLRVYDETIAYAGLSDSDNMAPDLLEFLKPDEQQRRAEPDELIDPPPEGDRSPPPPLVRQPLIRHPPMTTGHKQDVFSLPEGEVVLQWPEPLSPESFEDFESWLNLVLRRVRRSVREPAKEPKDDPLTESVRGEQAGANVSLMITQGQKNALRDRGYTDEQIHEMKPEDAHRVLGIVN
jgi:hypothetical protein